MLPDTLLNDVSDVLERRSQLLELVVAEGDVVRDVALVSGRVERFLELGLGILVLLLLVKDATLGHDGFARVGRHLRNQALGVRHLLKLVLDMHLELQDLVGVIRVIDLLGHLRRLLVHAGLEEALGVVELVLDDIGVELGELVVHIRCAAVVLNVEIAVGQQGKCRSVAWGELELVGEDADDLHVLLVPDQRVDRLSVLAIGHGPKL